MVSKAVVIQSAANGAVAAELALAGFVGAEEVGRGGFGVVFRATQQELDRLVAVKVLTAANLERNRARFLREQRAMGRLTGHPNIVAVLEVGETTGGHPYLVMPYHGQGSLQQQISRRGVLAVDEALRVGVKVASALESAHRLGILHRDVKPGNILLNDYDDWALTDFGIAHIPDGFTTAVGIFSGSPAFSAPEVIAGEPPSAASDVYGLGATLFAALTGHAAFERHDGEQVVAQFVRITSETPDFSQHGLPAGVAEIVSAAMARRPADRPSTVEAGRQFEKLLSERHTTMDSVRRPVVSRASDNPRSPARTGRATVPQSLINFVGRSAELVEAARSLKSCRLVTIVGVGGVGKTSLAKQAAVTARHDFADGVRLVELADLRQASLLVEFVAGALGVRDKSDEQLSEVLVDFLRPQQILLVLDNCEHVIDSVADIAETLLRSCPGVQILATSRERLDAQGETVLPLSPMSFPTEGEPAGAPTELVRFDAVELFVQQARASDADFTLTHDNARAVARICARLEGLPLAVELAAARLRVLSVDEIAEALTDRYALLTRGRRGAPGRQRTLESCIEWSYQLCSPAEQQLWNQLSVFAGSFDTRAVQEICGDRTSAAQLLDLMSSLVDKSILVRIEQRRHVRFRLLETLREYGHSRLKDTEDFDALSQRHADWYRRLLADADAEWFSSRQHEWIHRASEEMPNIRKALDYNLDHHPAHALEMTCDLRRLWSFTGMLTEGRRWVARALDADTTQDPSLHARALYTNAHLAFAGGDMVKAAEYVTGAKESLERGDDPLTRGLVTFLEGFICMALGAVEDGIRGIRAAMDATDDVEVQEQSKIVMAWLFALDHDYQQALTWFQDALTAAKIHGDSVLRAQSMSSLGIGHWLLGDAGYAIQAIRESLQLSRTVNDLFTASQSLELLSWVTAAEGDALLAGVLRAAALAVSRASGASAIVYATVGPWHTECDARLNHDLSSTELSAADIYGATLSLEQAVAVALDGLPPNLREEFAAGEPSRT
jgi:non-specific serine/threonine protein kinase